MAQKRAIPPIPPVDYDLSRVLSALKENVEIVTGQRLATIKPLDSTADTTDIINKVNEILERLQ